MSSRRYLLGPLLFLSACSYGNYGVNSVDHGYYRLQASLAIAGVAADGDPISGTKVEIAPNLTAFHDVNDPTSPNAYSRIAVDTSSKLEIIGGEATTDVAHAKPVPPPTSALRLPSGGLPDEADLQASLSLAPAQGTPGGGASNWTAYTPENYMPGVRFASTHFADGSTVEIKLTGTFNYYKMVNGVESLDHQETITTSIKPKAYNKLLAWKTTVQDDGVTAWPASDQVIIDGVLAAGHAAYSNANYGLVTTPSGPDLITRAQVLSTIFNGIPTALFANTHGGNGEVQASFGEQFLSFFYTWKYVSHPVGYSINSFYSCETMQTSDGDGMHYQNGQRPVSNYLQWIDSGRTGFRVTVYTEMRLPPNTQYPLGQPTGHTLAEHADAFFQALSDGYTLDKARRIANNVVFGQESPSIGYSSSTMLLLSPTAEKVYSDPLATLRYVYLGPGERPNAATSDTRWFYVP